MVCGDKLRSARRVSCLCFLLTLWMFLVGNHLCLSNSKGDVALVRIFLLHPAQIQEIKGTGIQIFSDMEGEASIDVIADQKQLDELIRRGFDIQVLLTAEELAALEVSLDPEYHTYEEMLDELLAFQSAYPQIAMLESIGVSTQERRVIWAFKISDNVHQQEDEPAVMYNGAHHACEVMGLEICMGLINDLLNDYGVDPDVTKWVDSTEIWFVPLVNPDGHSAVTDSISLYWRKNGRDLNGNGILYEYECNDWHLCNTEGVDVNRNYDFNWELGGSDVPWEWDYRGEYPFSEDESQAIRDLGLKERFVLSISYHSFGEYVLYPWIDWQSGTTAPDDSTLTDIAREISSRISKHSEDGSYDYGRASATVGYSQNWLYGTRGTFEFVIETVPYPIFIPPGPEVDSIYRANKPGALYILNRVRETSITGILSDLVTGRPLKAQVRIVQLDSPEVSPRTSDPVFGRYRWLLSPGTYDLEFSQPGYRPRTFESVLVRRGRPTVLDVQLAPYYYVPVLSPFGLILLVMMLVASAALILALKRQRPGRLEAG